MFGLRYYLGVYKIGKFKRFEYVLWIVVIVIVWKCIICVVIFILCEYWCCGNMRGSDLQLKVEKNLILDLMFVIFLVG